MTLSQNIKGFNVSTTVMTHFSNLPGKHLSAYIVPVVLLT